MQLCGENVHINDREHSQLGSIFFLKHFIFDVVSYYELFQLEMGFMASCREPVPFKEPVISYMVEPVMQYSHMLF